MRCVQYQYFQEWVDNMFENGRSRKNWNLCKLHRFHILYISHSYIYILSVAALDETIIPSCLHFSMQDIEQSHGLDCVSRLS